MTYRPNPETLAGRVLGFFALNPDEELTIEDIALKFVEPGDSRNVHTQLMAACDHDMIRYDPDEDVYRKGPMDMPSAFNRSADDEQAALLVRSIGEDEPKKRGPKPRNATTPRGSNDGLDGTGEGIAARDVPAPHGAKDRTEDEPPTLSGPAVRDEARPSQAEQRLDQTNRLGEDGSRLLDPQSHGNRPAKEGLEAGGIDRVGGGEWTSTSRDDADGQEPSVTAHDGQPWPVHVGAALGTGIGAEHAPGTEATLPAQGPGHAGHHPAHQPQAESPIATMRQMLMDTLVDLRRKDDPIPIDRAKAIADVATVIVNSARVEVEYLRVTQQRHGQFFEGAPALPGGQE